MKLIRFLRPLPEICHPPKNSKSWKTRGSARDAIGRTPASFSSHVVTWPVVWGARSKAKDARCVGRGWERKFALICHNVLAFINDLWNSTFIEWKLAWNWRAFLWRQNWWWINEYASKRNLWGNPKFYQPFFCGASKASAADIEGKQTMKWDNPSLWWLRATSLQAILD